MEYMDSHDGMKKWHDLLITFIKFWEKVMSVLRNFTQGKFPLKPTQIRQGVRLVKPFFRTSSANMIARK
jgi:hypothetical protein